MEPMRDFSGAPEPAPDMRVELVRLGGLIERGIETLRNEQIQYQEALRGVVIGEGPNQIVSENLSNEEGRLYRNLSRLSKATGVSIKKLLSGDSFTIEDVKIGGFDRSGDRVQFTGEELLKKIAAEDYSSYEMFAGLIRPEDIGDSLEAIAGELEQDPGLTAEQQETLDSYNKLQNRIDDLLATQGMLAEESTFIKTDEQLVNLSLAAFDALADEPVIADSLAGAIPRLNQALEELAPQLSDIDVYENPEVRKRLLTSELPVASPAPTTKDGVSDADAQRAAVSDYEPSAPPTTQFQGPPSEFGTRQPTAYPSSEVDQARRITARAEQPTVTPDDSPQTEEQRIAEGNRLFALNEMGYDLGPGTSGDDGPGGDVPDSDVPDSVPTPSVTFGTAANQAEVQRLLEERFGGLAFFLDKHEDTLQVGITESGEIVAASDQAAVTTKHVVDVLVEQGIVAPNLILGVVQKTQWYQETDAKMREHDVLVANMTDREKEEYLDPVMDILRDEAVYLGIGGTVTDKTLSEAANEIMRQGESGDMDFIRGSIIRWSKFDAAQSEASEFAALSDTVFALSKRYFTPIGSELSNKTAQQIYLGNQTLAGQEQLFRDQAKAAMPMLANAIDAGITPEQYFAPYKYRMEQILGRPNIDLYEDYPQVVSHIGDNGEMRPMTLSEMDRFARGLPEWQQSVQGQDAARSLSFAIGRTFGEVA